MFGLVDILPSYSFAGAGAGKQLLSALPIAQEGWAGAHPQLVWVRATTEVPRASCKRSVCPTGAVLVC